MKISIYTAVVLYCVMIAQGDRCRFNIPASDSVLKCGKNVYTADPGYIRAVNMCGYGRNGTEITDQDIQCILERTMFILDNHVVFGIMESLAPSNKRETFKHVGCRSKAYKEVCGHNTCDWINTFD